MAGPMSDKMKKKASPSLMARIKDVLTPAKDVPARKVVKAIKKRKKQLDEI